jgi:hypothetical protein
LEAAPAAPATGAGYWLAAADGGVFAFGDAPSLGSLANVALNKPVVGIAATPSGNGYWLAAADGGVFAFGDARFLGSGGHSCCAPPSVTVLVPTTAGDGYWLVWQDGVISNYGRAGFFEEGIPVPRRTTPPFTVGGDSPPDPHKLWTVDDRGRVQEFSSFAICPDQCEIGHFGDLTTAGVSPVAPVVAMAATPTGKGYWLAASDGGVFTFGDAVFSGSAAGLPLRRPVVGFAALS